MSDSMTSAPRLSSQRSFKRTKIPLPSDTHPAVMEDHPESTPVFAQLSFAPATKTTVVTTTTTTTTSFPPFILKASRDLLARDPRQYPLAAAPTPSGLKHFSFIAGGRVARFDENSSLGPVSHEVGHFENKDKSFTREEISDPNLKQVEATELDDYGNRRPTSSKSLDSSFAPRNDKKRPAPGESERHTQDAAESQQMTGVSKKARNRLRGLNNEPLTPRSRTMTRTRRYGHSEQTTGAQESPISLVAGSAASSLRHEDSLSAVNAVGPECQSPNNTLTGPPSPPSFFSVSAGVATPPIVEQDLEVMESYPLSVEDSVSVATSPEAVQDNSLPSPMLSPVTASASPLMEDFPFSQHMSSASSKFMTENKASEAGGSLSAPLSDLYRMIDTFDSYPVELQRYAMYQILRRSNKTILQFTADLVNPALKCDFLSRLPTELGLNVIRHLDAVSLCRSARVSRRWRELIDGDDQVWKDLIQKEGFSLPRGEVERAVREGWKWQGLQPAEKNLNARLSRRRSATPSAVTGTDTARLESLASIPRGTKRRAGLRESSNNKRRKPNNQTQDPWSLAESQYGRTSSPIDLQALTADIPELGLQSLRVPHLYKSIFRRHHGHRSSWMDKKTKPHHIAFRAHGRNVVTCLQFDDDKILTGSDDTKINVWDTNTGASRVQLNGHEGGVWALQYDGNTLVSGSTDRTVRIWDIEKGRCLHVFQGHTSTVRCLVILKPAVVGHEEDGTPIMMPKEPLIITGSRDSTLRVWKMPEIGDTPFNPTGEQVTTDEMNPYFLRALNGHVHSVRAITAHGDTLVSGSYDATVRVWRISTGDLVHRLNGHTQKVYSVILDHERNRCISGSMDNLVKVWSLETGQCLFNLEGHTSLVGLLDLNNDRLVSAAADWSLRVWDPETGQCKNVLTAHTGAITCFQHDGMKVVSGSDRSLKMWDIKTGELVRDLLTDLSGGWQVRFNDRKCVAAVQRNNHTYIEVLDFGAARDGISEEFLGERMLVDANGDVIADTTDDEDLDD